MNDVIIRIIDVQPKLKGKHWKFATLAKSLMINISFMFILDYSL